ELAIPVHEGHPVALNRRHSELLVLVHRPLNYRAGTQVTKLQTYIRSLAPLDDALPLKHNIRLSLDIERETFFHFVRRNHEALLLCDAQNLCQFGSVGNITSYIENTSGDGWKDDSFAKT